ncbi:MAG: FHA domain-containing serine/threonine-protein kinase [Lachnospiraceae bacterium]|nr:FHA domain-containing serine/threonine-protein kinase [Lachnospiraceae bacterium]
MSDNTTGMMCPNCFKFHFTPEGCLDCGYMENPQTRGGYTLPANTLLGNRFIIGRVLGIGGFGITYKAYDTLYRQICAVKEFAPSGLAYRMPGECVMQMHNSAAAPYYQHGLQRFIEEAQILKKLEDVVAVVQVKECFLENQTAYFAMEFLDGTNLKKAVKAAGGELAGEDVIRIIAEVGSAMGRIHKEAGILHRDISPENICILRNGAVKLLDFGSARQKTMDENQEFSVEFKHGFAPPEQYTRTGNQGPYTDVYALASTCYYALTGKMIPDAMDRLADKTYTPLCYMRPDIAPEISEAVDRALVLDYHQRTQSMQEFIYGICPDRKPEEVKAFSRDRKQVPFLEIISGSKAGVRWNLPENTKVRIGRSGSQSNIVIAGNPMISKEHCILIYDKSMETYLLQDVSSNGVFVNGKRLEKGKMYSYEREVEFSLAGHGCTIKAGVSYE